MISRVTPGFFRFAHFLPRGGLFSFRRINYISEQRKWLKSKIRQK